MGDGTKFGDEPRFLDGPSYAGPERRRRRVFVTSNNEYHIYDRTCVAVRTRGGDWIAEHEALGQDLIALMNPDGYWIIDLHSPVTPGWRLCFSNDLLTSPLRTIRRPGRETVSFYERFGHYATA